MSDTITINGLHSCKPGNDPIVGQIKTFVIEHRKGKSGKPYIKIRSANEENGGTPHRILSATKTDFVDQHGNISFNMEVEEAVGAAFQQARSTMNEPLPFQKPTGVFGSDDEQPPQTSVNTPPARSNGGDGVTEARKHLMQSANLYNLCVAAVDKAIAPWMPEVARTSEQFQAAVASLFIEASKEQWWSGKIVKPSLIDSMPTTPIKNGDQ